MAKFFGKVTYGYTAELEDQPGVWANELVTRDAIFDLIKNFHKSENNDKLNNDLVLDNKVSMLADPYAIQNFQHIKSVRFMDTEWKILTVEVQYPRLILTLGGVYNGE